MNGPNWMLHRHAMAATMSDANTAENRNVRTLLREVYTKNDRRNVFSLFVTGGGTSALEWVFTTAGASNTVMEAGVVYARSSLQQFIHKHTTDAGDDDGDGSYCSTPTSVRMSDAAWVRAAELLLADTRNFGDFTNVNLFGVSCTAALVTDRPKKGPHRVHVAASSQSGSFSYTVELQKGARNREEEDAASSRLIIDAIAECSGVPPLPVDYLLLDDTTATASTSPALGEAIGRTQTDREEVIERIYAKRVRQAMFIKKVDVDGISSSSDRLVDDFVILEDAALPPGCLVYPGSFNPLHEGHVALVAAAVEKIRGADGKAVPVVFEISAFNADKPPLDRAEMERRVRQFDPTTNPALLTGGLTNIAVAITSEPLFLGKTGLFRDANFLIGSDTLVRLLNPRYYGPPEPPSSAGLSPEEASRVQQQKVFAMIAVLSAVAERGCRFVVGGRATATPPPAATTATVVAAGNSSTSFATMQSILAGAVLALPQDLERALFMGLSEDEFRVDLSSTDIRAAAAATAAAATAAAAAASQSGQPGG